MTPLSGVVPWKVDVNLGTLLSFSALLLQVWMGVFFFVVARAPGWSRARLYTLVAFTAACYSAVDMLFSIEGLPMTTVTLIGDLNFLFAALHVSAWVVLSEADPNRPLETLSTPYRILISITILLGLGGVIPGVAMISDHILVEVRSLGVTYRQPKTTLYGDLTMAWFMLTLCIPFRRFVGDWRRRQPHARIRVLGFAVYFACAIDELLVTAGTIEFLYLADLGLLGIVVTLLIETLQKVLNDAVALKEASQRLQLEVSDRTFERDEAREALIVAERHVALGQLAAGVGHEINNPLTYVRGNLEHVCAALKERTANPEDLQLLQEALDGTQQIQRVVADLRAYVLPGVEPRGPVNVREELEAALKLATAKIGIGTRITREYAEHGLVLGGAHRLRQVFLNLILNAGQAIQDGRPNEPRLHVRIWTSAPLELTLEVTDNGRGITEGDLARLGEPYFSTRTDRGGTGLGLFVTRGILESLGGRLEFESQPGQGTTARVVLPTLQGQGASSLPPPASDGQRTSSLSLAARAHVPRVLVVDDDPSVARAIARQLRGAEVTIAHSGRVAIERMLGGDPFDLMLCDVMMPSESGRDVYEAIAATRPDLLDRLVFVTGGATIPQIAEFLAQDGVRYLTKPVQSTALEGLLRSRSRAAVLAARSAS
jgi:signal transduction histidine kinase/ActR/RegA family two-component response regulator